MLKENSGAHNWNRKTLEVLMNLHTVNLRLHQKVIFFGFCLNLRFYSWVPLHTFMMIKRILSEFNEEFIWLFTH